MALPTSSTYHIHPFDTCNEYVAWPHDDYAFIETHKTHSVAKCVKPKGKKELSTLTNIPYKYV